MKVPENFIVDLLDIDNNLIQAIGPAQISDLDKYKSYLTDDNNKFTDTVIIRVAYSKDNPVLYRNPYHKGIGYTLTYGLTVIPDYVVGPVNSIATIPPRTRITLYADRESNFAKKIITNDNYYFGSRNDLNRNIDYEHNTSKLPIKSVLVERLPE